MSASSICLSLAEMCHVIYSVFLHCINTSDIEVLGKMANLKQLTLKGNPVANEPDYKTKVTHNLEFFSL